MEQILYNDPNIIFVNHIEEYQGPQREHPKDRLIFLILEKGELRLNIDNRSHNDAGWLDVDWFEMGEKLAYVVKK